jgi:hypothetical protein
MAQPDFTALTGELGTGDVLRGVTEGVTPPNGGGVFVFGWHSQTTTSGVVGNFVNLTDFAPMAEGGRLRVAMLRAGGGGTDNYTAMAFIGLQGANVTDQGYILGLTEDEEPAHLVVRKGALSGGLPVADPGVIMTSTGTFAKDVWLHLLFDMIVQPSGDVRLKVQANDLASDPVTAPVFAAVAGMPDFIDDALGVNSGSAPFTSGRGGFAFRTFDINRRAYVDHFQLARQV